MKSFKKLSVLMLLIMFLAGMVTGCGQKADDAKEEPAPPQEEEFVVGFVYSGPVGDFGWAYAHDLGRQYLENNVSGVRTIYIEDVPAGPDAERAMNELIQRGARVVFTTSYGFMDFTINVAEQHPDVIFLNCSGFKTAENAGNYWARMYEASYLSGIAAGLKTETNILGYVGAFPVPLVVRQINAFALGAQSVNSDVTVNVIWTNKFYDPATEKEAALGLIDLGADVLAQYQNSPATQQAAQERGVWGISCYADMTQFAPQATLTGPVWNWGPYYADIVQQIMAGNWESHHTYWGSMKEGIVYLAPYNENVMTPEMIEAVEAAKAALFAGELDIFAGPIMNQAGELVVPEGSSMSDQEKLGMNWFVKGVQGNL
ncbi:BMP family ABC transporter substrate-binding protein [Desulfitibacter alkalitolerans]|uniref:BMP family ABC transporter substrate-binding protein n=1 Tax=Desulfitibacter alkalitolerans TaxID=264641 RepID=UPI000482097A|nr:BMP family ABC transporter substrate-binding protein [Desulfitibacter alkalitolerans]